MSARRFRSVGVDPATGKEAFVLARPGVVLEELADAHALKASAVLVTVVGAVLEAGRSMPNSPRSYRRCTPRWRNAWAK